MTGSGPGGPGTFGTATYIEFRTGDRLVRALPGDGEPTVTDGYAAYETVDRVGKTGLTRWTGKPPLTMSIPIILDGWLSGEHIDDDIRRLEFMAGRGPGVTGEPPDVEIDGPGVLVPHAGATWRVTGFDWGDAIIDENGFRYRQAMTVNVLQSVVDEHAVARSAARRRRADRRSHHHHRTHIVKKGETLRKIARKVLGDETRWTEIRQLNHIADPRKVGKCTDQHTAGCIGTKLKMPR